MTSRILICSEMMYDMKERITCELQLLSMKGEIFHIITPRLNGLTHACSFFESSEWSNSTQLTCMKIKAFTITSDPLMTNNYDLCYLQPLTHSQYVQLCLFLSFFFFLNDKRLSNLMNIQREHKSILCTLQRRVSYLLIKFLFASINR